MYGRSEMTASSLPSDFCLASHPVGLRVLLRAYVPEASRELVLAHIFFSEKEEERELGLYGLVIDEVDSDLEDLSPVGYSLS